MSRLNCLCKFRAAMPTRREANMVVAQVSLDDPRGLYQQRERRSCKAHGEGGEEHRAGKSMPAVCGLTPPFVLADNLRLSFTTSD